MLEFVDISVGDGSPCACSRCANAVAPRYYSTAQVAEAVTAAVHAEGTAPGPNLALTGPEPFGHPELPALVKACVDAGARRIALETDGAALSAHRNAEGVLRAGVRHLLVRLPDLVTAEGVHAQRIADSVAGVAAYRDAAVALDFAVAVTAIVPVCRHNLARLSETVSRAAALGFDAVRLTKGEGVGSSSAQAIAAACDTGMVNRMWVETDGSLPLPDSHRLHDVTSEADHD